MSRKKDDKLAEKLEKFKSKGVYDRLTGTSNDTSISNTKDESMINNKSIATSIDTDKDTSEIKSEDIIIDKNIDNGESNDTSIVTNNADDTSIVSGSVTIDHNSNTTAKNNEKSKFISNDTVIDSVINDTNRDSKSEVEDTTISTSNITSNSVLPPVETDEKKYVNLYLKKSVADRLDQFVKDQIKQQKLDRNKKIKSFYGQIALEEFLRKHGY